MRKNCIVYPYLYDQLFAFSISCEHFYKMLTLSVWFWPALFYRFQLNLLCAICFFCRVKQGISLKLWCHYGRLSMLGDLWPLKSSAVKLLAQMSVPNNLFSFSLNRPFYLSSAGETGLGFAIDKQPDFRFLCMKFSIMVMEKKIPVDLENNVYIYCHLFRENGR